MAIALEIVSPEKLLISKPVDMVVIPAAEGDLGVLPEHAPMIVMLRGGTIAVHQAGQVTGPSLHRRRLRRDHAGAVHRARQ